MTTVRPCAGSVPRVQLFWIPLGAGSSPVVRRSGQVYEHVLARHEHREAGAIYHAGLTVSLDRTYAIEMAPAWQSTATGRRAHQGPVGSRLLGVSRLFRYEITCSGEHPIPDAGFAVGPPLQLETDLARAERLLEIVPTVPKLVWGRDEIGAGEMWNSNSVIAWLLHQSGHSSNPLGLPRDGRAPGWQAGRFLPVDSPLPRKHSEWSTS